MNLVELIKIYSPRLHVTFADPALTLGAIAQVESSFGVNKRPRLERAYCPNGKYFNASNWDTFGASVACSYSSFQIMYPVAVEMGFPKTVFPSNLNDDELAILYVIKLINSRIIPAGCKSLSQLADAYNSGNFRDLIVPFDYIAKINTAYESCKSRF